MFKKILKKKCTSNFRSLDQRQLNQEVQHICIALNSSTLYVIILYYDTKMNR